MADDPQTQGSARDRDHGPSYLPVGDYALLSDCHGSALVSRGGSIDWCCVQRFDARPVFARLLDHGRGGFFRIAPGTEAEVRRRYLPGTLILETAFQTATGRLTLIDFMALAPEDADDPEGGDVGEEAPGAEDRLIRIVRCDAGRVDVRVDFEPRFEYGVTVPHIRQVGGDHLTVFGGPDALVLQSGCELEVREEGRAVGHRRMDAGDVARFVLSYQRPHELHPVRLEAGEVDARLDRTRAVWEGWSARSTYRGEYGEAVQRSAMVLKALSDVRTGAIVAAPTTSLPEDPGGVRNWDYRYTWLRDASFVMEALFLLGYRLEGERFLDWLHRTVAGVPEALQIMYGAGGDRLLPEVELDGLEGYEGSAPVRVGNAAARQFQLDIYGDVLHAAWRAHRHGGVIDDDLWALLATLVEFVIDNRDRPDSGLWEVRSEPRRFVHSRVMAWVAVDRGIRIARDRGTLEPVERWERERERIRATVMERGVIPRPGGAGRVFRRAFELDEPDAAALLFPDMGFIDADDPLAVNTREWIVEQLGQGDLLRRYRGEDGLPGGEGAFLACSFWLVENLAWSGELDRAVALFERLLERRNDLGLLSEQVSVDDGRMLGNYPQALSHIGLINAAVTLRQAREAPRGDEGRSDEPREETSPP